MHTLEQLRSGALAGMPRINLSCGLTEFPAELFALAGHLEILDLSGNQLSSLPDELPRLHKLRILFCADNQFKELPAVLGQCTSLRMIAFKANQITHIPESSLPPRLRWLTLTDNQIDTLPASIGRCTQLQKLLLAGNRLHALPPALSACRQLELIRLSANRLGTLPDWLFGLPRLAWLAFGGNPPEATLEASALDDPHQQLPSLDWSSLQWQGLLGEGASGVIHQAEHAHQGTRRQVAVKLFKGAMTSDGLPRSEMAACIRAGQHAALIPLLGRVAGHPEGIDGLVMQRIGAEFRNLALPPSLDSCTRDVYPAQRRLALRTVLRIARQMAAAGRHLHAQGVLHGDFYAHNILSTEAGESLLGDFGAASLYDPADLDLGQRLQALEVRAYGCLLEELLDHSSAPDTGDTAFAQLRELSTRCLDDTPAQRPDFEAIQHALRHTH